MAHEQALADAYSYARTSTFSYYTAADGAKAGLLKSETVEPGNAQLCVTTTYDYDAYGNKKSSNTANCAGATGRAVIASRSSSSTFAAVASQSVSVGTGAATVSIAAGLFADTATNALNQSESRTFDPRFGAALTLTGPNGLTTRWKVDDFGRKTLELRADGTSTVTAYCVIGAGLDTSGNSNAGNGDPMTCPAPAAGEAPADAVMFTHTEPRDTVNAKMGPYVRVYTDRLGRELRSVTESFDGGAQASGYSAVPVYKDTVYSTYGVKVLQTQPYFAGHGSSTTTGSDDVGVTKVVVDALGRPTAVYTADPQGQAGTQTYGGSGAVSYGLYGSRTSAKITYTYNGLDTVTTNDKGQTHKEEKNPIGELVRVTDHSQAQIAYQRDAFGNLLVTKDALQNQVALTYDTRGRKTQLVDPDTGTWNYDYDALGQLVWQQSPNQLAAGTSTTMAYDVLGRMTSRTEPEYVSNWYYDRNADASYCMLGSAPNRGAGKLCESKTTAGLDRRTVYDSLGRPINSRTDTGVGPSFAAALGYDANTGLVATQTYPTGVQVRFSYTTRGYLEQLLLNTAAAVTPISPSQCAGGNCTLAAGSVLWKALVVGAWGKAEQQYYGNGITNKAIFEGATGRITDLQAGTGNSVLAQHYAWDSLNKLTYRADDNGDGSTGAVTEHFFYADGLNRLTSYDVNAPQIPGLQRVVNLQYNALGLLLYKSDVGNYSYPAQGVAAVRPHALQTLTGASSTNYYYDANGNLSSTSGGKYRSVSYTSFNLPDSSTGLQGPAGSPKYTWQYDENHARIKETRVDGSGTRTTWNLHPDNQGGLGFESETGPSGSVSNRHYLSAGGQSIGVLVSAGALPTLSAGQTAPAVLSSVTLVKVEYWHKDHLGSLITTTDHAGAVTQRYAYDPFGMRRYSNGRYDEFGNLIVDWNSSANWGTDRGFTGHEHLDDVGVVHMNGRIFDPTLGVFLQADPFIQDAGNLQSYNRYGYCWNNPMGCTDPSGFCFMGCFWQPKHWGVVGKVAFAYIAYQFLGPLVGNQVAVALFDAGVQTTTVLAAASFASAATAGFAIGAANSGSMEGGLQGAFSAVVFAGVGDYLNGSGLFAGEVAPGEYSGTGIVLHGVAGCVTSVASGSKCGPGALSAAISQAATPYKPNDIVGGTVVSMIIGGTTSVLGGGKFANGAETAAFGYLFNCLAHECLKHYMEGSGKPLQANFSELGADNVGPERFPKYRALVSNEDLPDGTYQVDDKIGWQTGSLNARAAYGRVILQLNGELTVSQGQSTFKGTITAPPDLYDFDPQPWGARTVMGEVSTRGGAALPGKPFYNVFTGGKSVNSTGMLSPFNCCGY